MKRIAITLFQAIMLIAIGTTLGLLAHWYLVPRLSKGWQETVITVARAVVVVVGLVRGLFGIMSFLKDLSSKEQSGPLYMPPRPLAEFVGRKDEIRRLTRHLKPGTKTAIIGMGGIGKTELAKLAASRVVHRFPDGVLWADCGLQDLANIADLWASAYDAQLPGDDPLTKATAWRNLIGDKKALLIFDDVQPGRSMEPLFPPRGRSTVLITTRQAKHLDLYAADERLPLGQFTPDEARALVETVLGQAAARRQTGDAARLFKLVGYLPLGVGVALRLAVKCGWSLATLNQELEEAGALTVLGEEEALRKSLNATFELAWDNLPDDLRDTFHTLTLFNEGPSFSTQALADTLALDESKARARLHRLAGRSLIFPRKSGYQNKRNHGTIPQSEGTYDEDQKAVHA